MVKNTLLPALLAFLLCFPLLAAPPLESPFVEFLSGEEDLGKCIEVLENGKNESGLAPMGYLSLYYFLKAGGQREKAILTALEGLDSDPGSPAAPMLADVVEDEMTFNALTEGLAGKLLGSALSRVQDDPVLRFRLLRSVYVIAARKGDRAGMESALDEMGIPPGAFYEAPEEELPRTRFIGSGPYRPPERATEFFPRNNQFLNMPSSLLRVKGEYFGRMHVPFNSSGAEDFYLLVSSRSPVRVFVDGAAVFENNPFFEIKAPVNIVRLSLKGGAHQLTAAFHSLNNNEGVSLALSPAGSGSGGKIEFLGEMPASVDFAGCSSAGIYVHPVSRNMSDGDHLSLGMNALLCRSTGDYAGARHLLEQAISLNPYYLLWKLALVEIIIEKSYDLPESYALSRAESIVDGILEKNPGCPEALFYKIYLKSSSSQGEEFLSELRNLTEDSPTDPRWFIQLSRELGDLGWTSSAKDVLLRTRTLFPQNSEVEEEWLSFCEARKNMKDRFEAMEALSKLRIAPREYEEYWAQKGDYSEAVRWIDKQKEILGDPTFSLESRKLDYFQKMGMYREALEGVDRLLSKNPRNRGWVLMKARILYLTGRDNEAKAALEELKASEPSAFDVDYAKWLEGQELPFEKERISLEEVLSGESPRPDGAPSSYLLDHQVTRVYEDGSTLERYHGVVAVHDRDGVEREGEQQFPSDYLLVLRTIKPDGTEVEPEFVPNKNTVGMSGLEAGDIIEYEYLSLTGPNGIKKGSYYTPFIFMFQDVEKPFARTCWSIKYPSSFKMTFFEQNLPSPPSVSMEDGLTVRRYEYRSMPRVAREPDLPFKNLYLPLVDAVGNMDWKDYALALKDQVTGSYQISPDIRKKCAELLGGAASDKEKARTVINFVLSSIEGEGKGWGNPTETLLLGEGNRLQLAMAMFGAAGVRFDLLFAKPVTEEKDRNDLPSEGRFQIPVLRIYPDGAPEDYYLESPYRNIGILPWYLQGAEAMPVTSPEPWKTVRLREDWSPWESCPMFEQRNFDGEGNLLVGLSQTLDPDQGTQFRSAFKKLPKDRWKEVLQMAFAKQFGNVEITDYEFRNLDDYDRELVMTATAKVSSYAVAAGGVLRIEEPIDRLELMRNFGSLEKRSLPLSTGSPFIISQTYRITLPEGDVSAVFPGKKKITSKYGSYYLSVKRKPGGCTIERKASIPFQIVPPEEYAAFVSFLKQLDDAENMTIEVKLK